MFEDDRKRYAALAAALVLIGGAIAWIEAPWREGSTVPDPPPGTPADALENPGAPNFAGATHWLNTDEPVDIVEQRGEVVLIDFWTYSCINCIHTFPYLRAWHEHYDEHGLEVVGVHTPEFRFERDPANVRQAIDRYDLSYPVAMDNDYEIWDAYHVHFWPSKFLVDQYGRIEYSFAGEGGYERTEETIRRLLREAGHDVPESWANVSERTGGVTPGQTPELFTAPPYEGVESAIANEPGYQPGETITYERPDEIPRDAIVLSGTWHNADEHVEARSADATVTVDFRAGGSNFVAGGPGECVEVRLDGEPIDESVAARSVEFVNGTPCIFVEHQRSYDFYAGDVERHTVELTVPEGFELYTFAFSEEGRR